MQTRWSEQVEQETLEELRRLIRLKTITTDHNEMELIRYLKEIFDREGIACEVFESAPGRGNIIARLPGGDRPPILLMSHIDVVDADRSKWVCDPFAAETRDGIIYGRGTLDTKQLTVMQLMTMLLLRRGGVSLNREVVFVATADEEAGSAYGMQYLIEQHGDKIPHGYAFNEGGGFVMEVDGKRFRTCACGEKGVCEIKVTLQGGTDPYDRKTSAFAQAVQLMHRVADYRSPLLLCDISAGFKDTAGDAIEKDATLQNLWEYSVHNTMGVSKFCLDNAMSQPSISLDLAFRFIPTITKEQALATLTELLDGLQATYQVTRSFDGYQSCISDEFIRLLAEKSDEFGPPATLLPMVALGNTDGRFLRHNVYGYSPMLGDIPFAEVLKKVHLHNECISEASMLYGTRVVYETVLAFSQNNQEGVK